MRDKIQAFLAGRPFAVAGASADRGKFGNKVLRCYLQHELPVSVVHPRAAAEPELRIEGVPAYAKLGDLPEVPHGLSIVTPPAVTEKLVEQCIEAGVSYVWMQPGAESALAIEAAERAGLGVIHGGPCILVELGFDG